MGLAGDRLGPAGALVLWFCVNAGFLAGPGAAVALLALGIYFLRSKPEAGSLAPRPGRLDKARESRPTS